MRGFMKTWRKEVGAVKAREGTGLLKGGYEELKNGSMLIPLCISSKKNPNPTIVSNMIILSLGNASPASHFAPMYRTSLTTSKTPKSLYTHNTQTSSQSVRGIIQFPKRRLSDISTSFGTLVSRLQGVVALAGGIGWGWMGWKGRV